jgi:hypothetical protein
VDNTEKWKRSIVESDQPVPSLNNSTVAAPLPDTLVAGL